MTAGPWKPTKPVAYLLAALTVWGPVYMVLFLTFMMFMFTSFGSHPGKSGPPDLFMYIFPLHLLTMLLMFALTAAYIVHAFRNDELAPDRRILWVIILFMGNMFAFPVYWWLYIRPSRPMPASEVAPQPGVSS
jgi:hypothetical protein